MPGGSPAVLRQRHMTPRVHDRPPAAPRDSSRVHGRLRAELRERQMTARELGELTGLDATVVARALAPHPDLFLDEALAIAAALECPLRVLFRLA